MEDRIIDLLKEHRLRITQTRQQVLSQFLAAGNHALANADIESQLEDIDRITLYRTLKTFEESGLIHGTVDAKGKQKYALCTDCDEHHHSDNHPHFHCSVCGQTTCLETVGVPPVKVPTGYQVSDLQIVLSGVCIRCTAK